MVLAQLEGNLTIRTDYTVLEIISISLLIASFVIMIYAGYLFQKKREDFKLPKYLIYIGVINLAWRLILFIIPVSSGTTPITDMSYIIYILILFNSSIFPGFIFFG